jgi:hypothetical protein
MVPRLLEEAEPTTKTGLDNLGADHGSGVLDVVASAEVADAKDRAGVAGTAVVPARPLPV